MGEPFAGPPVLAELAVKGYRLARIEDLAPGVWVRRLTLSWNPGLEVTAQEWIQLHQSYEPFSPVMKFATTSAFQSSSISALLHPTNNSVVVLGLSEPHYGDLVTLWSGSISGSDRLLFVQALQSGARLMALGESYLEESDAIMQAVRLNYPVNRAVDWWAGQDLEYIVFTPTRGVRIVSRGRIQLEAQADHWWLTPRSNPDRIDFSIFGKNSIQVTLPGETPLLDLSGEIKVVRAAWDLISLTRSKQS